jgi:hypothetical protein
LTVKPRTTRLAGNQRPNLGNPCQPPAPRNPASGRWRSKAVTRKDKDGQWLQGDKNYTLRVPANAPAKQFWALTLYDTETRTFIDTQHDIAGLDSRKDLIKNADGSVDLTIGPEAPQGKEKNWIPTAPDRGWFGLFRLYAPTEAYFDRSWKLPDLVHVK